MQRRMRRTRRRKVIGGEIVDDPEWLLIGRCVPKSRAISAYTFRGAWFGFTYGVCHSHGWPTTDSTAKIYLIVLIIEMTER